MRLRDPAVLATMALACLTIIVAACGASSASRPLVTIEPLTPTPRLAIKQSSQRPPPSPTQTAPAPAPTNTAAPAASTSTPLPPRPTSTPEPPPGPPSEGRWIDVDVTNYVVRLMDGDTVLREIGPVAVGVQIDTGEYLSTQTGLFRVHTKIEALAYDAPYDTYISHWVGFDAEKDNGFHSFLKDEHGTVVDASTGRVSNGCIRVGEAEALFGFAEIGMAVYVHF